MIFKGKTNYKSFIFLIWWPFQWKSLISLELAHLLTFSWVISTDLVRNIFRVVANNDYIKCSTSKMSNEIFNMQRKEISNLLYEILKFYSEREEKVIIEWIHFSQEFLKYAIENWAKCFFLDNKLSWEQKVKLKKITTPITKIIDWKTKKEILKVHTEDLNINNILYFQQEEKYFNMHNMLLKEAIELDIKIISYKNMKEAIKQIKELYPLVK